MFNSWYGGLLGFPTGYGHGKMTAKKLTKFKNDLVFQNVFSRLLIKAMNRWHFEGLPDTMDERTIKLASIYYCGAELFENNGSVLSLPAVPDGGGLNIYGNFNKFWVFSRNALFNKKVDTYIRGSEEDAFLNRGTSGILGSKAPKGVFIWENAIRYPFINLIIYYAQAIADSMRAIDVCRANIKSPFIITAEESIVNTVRGFFKDRDRNEEYIISSGIFPADKIQIMPIEANESALQSCIQLIEWLQSQYDELCGIDTNTQIDKKGENLISDELDINDMRTELNVDACVKEINKNLNDFNRLFGYNIKCVKTYEEKKKEEAEYESENVQRGEGDDGGIPE